MCVVARLWTFCALILHLHRSEHNLNGKLMEIQAGQNEVYFNACKSLNRFSAAIRKWLLGVAIYVVENMCIRWKSCWKFPNLFCRPTVAKSIIKIRQQEFGNELSPRITSQHTELQI